MKNLYIILFTCCFYTCQKAVETPLTIGKQLEGRWKVYSERHNDSIEYINDYESYTFKFLNYNGKYGAVSQEWLTKIGGIAKYDYFYVINEDGDYLTRYLNEEDIPSDFNNGGWRMILKKDSLTLYNAGFEDNGNYTSLYTRAFRIK